LRSSEIIASVGSEIDNRVDLENPNWIVLVEIIGKLVGISVLRPNEIFSSLIEKRQGGTVT
jgi:tRNA acetyltransferase TAN1